MSEKIGLLGKSILNPEGKSKISDGSLGFEMPRMAPEVVAQLLAGHAGISSSVPGFDPRYTHKTR